MSKHLFAVVALLMLPSIGYSNNNYFLPGDAFFHATLTQKVLEVLQESEPPYVFDYSFQNAHPQTFTGYAGYRRAQVESMTPQFLRNLRWTYDRVRSNPSNPRVLREVVSPEGTTYDEINGLHLFLVREDFDIENRRLRIGLRYNENWVEEAEKFGKYLQLCCFIQTPMAIETSWRDSKWVPGLNVTLPEADTEEGRAIESPIMIKGKVKALIIPTGPLEPYFEREDVLDLFVVTEEETRYYMSKDSRWKLFETHRHQE